MTPNLYDEGPYECVLCSGRFKTEERTKEHHRIDHGIKNAQQLNAAVTERLGPYVISSLKPVEEEACSHEEVNEWGPLKSGLTLLRCENCKCLLIKENDELREAVPKDFGAFPTREAS